MTTPNQDLALKLFVVLARASRSLMEHAKRDVEKSELSQTEFAVLEVLYHKGQLTIGEIGERVLLTSGSMTYVVDKLERRSLVERKPCPEDHRATYIALTGDGRRLLGRIFPGHAAAIERAAASLTADEKRTAIALLKKLGIGADREL
jgi:MarR family 2-MHQ and catechol resistance regulon transcriptional repressor